MKYWQTIIWLCNIGTAEVIYINNLEYNTYHMLINERLDGTEFLYSSSFKLVLCHPKCNPNYINYLSRKQSI